MNREEQIKMWEAAANMYGKLGAKEVGKMETKANEQGRPLTPSEKAAAVRHAQNASKAASKQGSAAVRGSAAVHGSDEGVRGSAAVHGSSAEAAAKRKNLFGK